MVLVKTKQWGNSIGVIIPSDVVRNLDIRPNEEIVLEVTKKKVNVLRELFGALPSKKPTEQVLREAKSNESKYF